MGWVFIYPPIENTLLRKIFSTLNYSGNHSKIVLINTIFRGFTTLFVRKMLRQSRFPKQSVCVHNSKCHLLYYRLYIKAKTLLFPGRVGFSQGLSTKMLFWRRGKGLCRQRGRSLSPPCLPGADAFILYNLRCFVAIIHYLNWHSKIIA